MLNTDVIHASWKPLIMQALTQVNSDYLNDLSQHENWLPGKHAIFNAFQLPLSNTQAILFGESPYPRPESANGFAFWDANVKNLWSDTGLDKHVNRATSLRNMIKCMLLAENYLNTTQLTQEAIAKLDKSALVQTAAQLFSNFARQGVLLLNASLVLSDRKVKDEAKQWVPFIRELLRQLGQQARPIKLILMGKIAETILALPESSAFPHILMEHPYNLSFIHNPNALQLFGKWELLSQL